MKNKAILLGCLLSLVACSQVMASAWFAVVGAGDQDTVKRLLDQGADVNQRDSYGDTALMLALKEGCLTIINILIDRGADMNLQDLSGDTPLMYAVRHHRNESVRLLLEAGANVNIQNQDGDTALMLADEHRVDSKVIWLLLRHGAAVTDCSNVFSDILRRYCDPFIKPAESTSWFSKLKSFFRGSEQPSILLSLIKLDYQDYLRGDYDRLATQLGLFGTIPDRAAHRVQSMFDQEILTEIILPNLNRYVQNRLAIGALMKEARPNTGVATTLGQLLADE